MLSIAEWTDRALALSSLMKLTSSASFSPSIRISLRLKIHQAQAKNFCRVLDIRVTKFVESDLSESGFLQVLTKMICYKVRRIWDAKMIDIYILTFVIAVSAEFSVGLLLLFHLKQYLFELRH